MCVWTLSVVQPPFRLVGVGLLVWCVSALVAGLSRGLNSYAVLVAARMLSGVGEASFQVCGCGLVAVVRLAA